MPRRSWRHRTGPGPYGVAMTVGAWVALAAVIGVLLGAVATVIAVQNRRALRGHGISVKPAAAAAGNAGTAGTGTTDATNTLVAFVANPTKPGVPARRDVVVRACAARHLPEPLWYETTPEDPGVGQTREAVE